MISRLDRDTGLLMKQLKELGLDNNTLVIFSSDNGTTHLDKEVDFEFFESVGPLRGLKGSLYEGGIRVPMIARWPGKIKPSTTTDHVSGFYDVMPTIAEVVGIEPPPGIDGISFAPTLFGQPERQQQHEFLYWEFGGYGGQQAVRMGDWKGVRQNMLRRNNPDPLKIELYNLRDDIGESRDVAAAASRHCRPHSPDHAERARPQQDFSAAAVGQLIATALSRRSPRLRRLHAGGPRLVRCTPPTCAGFIGWARLQIHQFAARRMRSTMAAVNADPRALHGICCRKGITGCRVISNHLAAQSRVAAESLASDAAPCLPVTYLGNTTDAIRARLDTLSGPRLLDHFQHGRVDLEENPCAASRDHGSHNVFVVRAGSDLRMGLLLLHGLPC